MNANTQRGRAASLIALTALGAALGAAAPALAQSQGAISASCNVMGYQGQMYAQYEALGGVGVFQNGSGGFGGAIDTGDRTIYWQGYIDGPYGRYMLNGENAFATATPQGGVYSDQLTVVLNFTSQTTFTISDAYSSGQALANCQITGMQ